MKCPVCKTSDLLMAERRSIEIDYCPTCRGIWLDRGELDKLIALEDDAPDASVARHSRDDDYRRRDERRYDHGRKHDDDYRSGNYGHRRKRSLFDMFDFD
ncbi:zf-TFIIB domain-containing protein [Trinickia caryophylli]|uniref:Transcription factor zinc-finger domain-containing protein n=1 Tax=Trinickia caryophylli TaxID=28094 RepID=A0A1X7H9P7_TRICW|nr:zf-TFIIB domain-containing protein [Trinickia caryophylli]PMS08984.1 hypothetical protein C0Z17_27280 [Trinickia caryophylli]TRX15022.1 hypothetical protein FNF07_27865 [Trinickia caryophylli]WQE14879.1 zf-TFIIB domain-containing protein [Trinickia caryophylli]SMF82201.1 hypothetical protein SAMN06295900_12525 [Trinickia caryophylli]GLU35773.1 hypothetical protein Busp01_56150 [Trinickia caryophylli]